MASAETHSPAADHAGRERILERVRNALQAPAHQPPPTPAQPVFAPVTDPLERFQAECLANNTELILSTDEVATAAAIESVLDSLPAGEVFLQDSPWLRSVSRSFMVPRNERWSSEGAPSEGSEATVTECELLVALTGSIVVSSACGGRGASIVAPCHIVVARLEQLVPDLETALARVHEMGLDAKNSFVGLITGSSRTADIEKILVLGAHGPRRLVLVVQTGA
ncbi:MAG TPA: LUD domain-containing protein [Terriglobales bacterium]|nr:LUD domain-containing protein [Terriglobales bacterium]